MSSSPLNTHTAHPPPPPLAAALVLEADWPFGSWIQHTTVPDHCCQIHFQLKQQLGFVTNMTLLSVLSWAEVAQNHSSDSCQGWRFGWECTGREFWPGIVGATKVFLQSHIQGLMSHLCLLSVCDKVRHVGFPDASSNANGRWAPLSLQQGTNDHWWGVAWGMCFQLHVRVKSYLTSTMAVCFPYLLRGGWNVLWLSCKGWLKCREWLYKYYDLNKNTCVCIRSQVPAHSLGYSVTEAGVNRGLYAQLAQLWASKQNSSNNVDPTGLMAGLQDAGGWGWIFNIINALCKYICTFFCLGPLLIEADKTSYEGPCQSGPYLPIVTLQLECTERDPFTACVHSLHPLLTLSIFQMCRRLSQATLTSLTGGLPVLTVSSFPLGTESWRPLFVLYLGHLLSSEGFWVPPIPCFKLVWHLALESEFTLTIGV